MHNSNNHHADITKLLSKAIVMMLPFLAFLPVTVAQQGEREQDRLQESGKVMKETPDIPENIPQPLLNRAECVIVLPSVKKVAVGVGGSFGRGAMTCRTGERFDGPWSAPIGWQATDYVILVMNERGARSMMGNKVKLGADASLAAGPKGRTATAVTNASMQEEMLSYSRSRGAFAGGFSSGSNVASRWGSKRQALREEGSALKIS